MTNTIDFLPFATGASANVEAQSAWVTDTVVTNGFQSGITLSIQMNKALRQGTFVAASIANLMSLVLNASVLDNGAVATFEEQLWQTLLQANYFVDAGSANTIVITEPTGLSFPNPVAGTQIYVKMAATNTGSTTLNWCGNGAVAVKTQGGSNLNSSTLAIGGIYNFVFDGTEWQYIL